MHKPIKRHEALKPLSREHHQGLLICWKIRTGIKKGIEIERIGKHLQWFYTNHLTAHFRIEERYVFPVLDSEHPFVLTALEQHKNLATLFLSTRWDENMLLLVEKELEKHIRFEERVLFNRVQEVATPEQLNCININHSSKPSKENWNDEYWV